MFPFVLHPTELSQWHAIVNEAQVSTHVLLNESTESYLVFLLMRFSHNPQFIDSVIALDFLESIKNRKQQFERLKEVGDKSLLFCGLFPGIARKRHVSLEYFSHIGQSAYLTVGELDDNKTNSLYIQLGEQFLSLQRILATFRTQRDQNQFMRLET